LRRLLTRLLKGSVPALARVSSERRPLLHRLEKRLGVKFRNLSLLECALTHRSYLARAGDGEISNERMEFLGDAVLGLVVSAFLYGKYPEEREGRLTKMKSLVVSGAVLAQRADSLGLGRYLRLSSEESASGGRTRESILADAFEAVVGATYLDRGLSAAEGLVTRLLLNELAELSRSAEHVNYKSLLQELAQARHRLHPEYRVRRETGPDHHKIFTIEVLVGGRVLGEGRGKSKKEAEQRAAREALEVLKPLRRTAHEGRRRRARPAPAVAPEPSAAEPEAGRES
jgi:ribonuclease-3